MEVIMLYEYSEVDRNRVIIDKVTFANQFCPNKHIIEP